VLSGRRGGRSGRASEQRGQRQEVTTARRTG
jgi:hypothetical protein